MKSLFVKAWYFLSAIPTWMILTCHNTWGIFNVFFIVWVRPIKGGVARLDHPFATGINPANGQKIWHDNLLFASERKKEFPKTDAEILEAVGEHLSGMFKKSCEQENQAHGIKDRMPPAINYIHGGIHYNGGFIIFDDVADALSHFSNATFRKHFWKFVLTEKREPVTILREKNYERMNLLQLVCAMRTYFPWFSNSNGNGKRIGWGNPAPYPAINTITGFWKDDTYKFYNRESAYTAPRPAVARKYFEVAGSYEAGRTQMWLPERFLAYFTNDRVVARGLKGNVFFVDNRKLRKGFLFDGANLPTIVERLPERISDKIKTMCGIEI